jgi:DNA-binding LytR/AlgR family response regulator
VKITINIDENLPDLEIVINGNSLSAQIETIIATLRMLDSQMTVTRDGESYILDVAKIVYIESVDRKTFVYTQQDCYESKLKLYEIEQQLCRSGFLRISKASLVNLKYVRSLRSELDRKIRLTLETGEQIIVSRQYADELKHRLGVK